MSLILSIETASKNCSVSISNNGQILDLYEYYDEHYSHSEKLHVLIESMLSDLDIDITKIDAFCFSSGPGSYTGLRIGASSIKGFAYSLDKPVIGVSTLKSMAFGMQENIVNQKKSKYDILCPVLDSRQGEVYLAMYDASLEEIHPPCACVVKDFSFLDFIKKSKILFFGPNLHKLDHFRTYKNIDFFEGFLPSAKYMSKLAFDNFSSSQFIDNAYFEPLYLKPFITNSTPKKNII